MRESTDAAGDEKCVQVLLDQGVDPNTAIAARKGRAALHDASRYGKVEACQALISVGQAVCHVHAHHRKKRFLVSLRGMQPVV